MSRTRNSNRLAINSENLSGKEAIFMLMPWSCKHQADHSEIEAYVAATGEWETIASIRDAAGVDAEILSSFIVRVVNYYEATSDLIVQMASALELCIACDGKLSWEAEHEAQIVLGRVKVNAPE